MSAKPSGRTKERRATQAGRSAAIRADTPWVRNLGRVGVGALGVVYLLLAWISLQVAFGGSSKSADNSGALHELAGKPFGRWLLALMAIGLFAYAVWQLLLAAIGYQQEKEAQRLGQRIGAVAKAVVGLALGVQAAKLAIGSSSKDSSKNQEDWTAKLLGAPAGRVLVVIVGLVVIGVAGFLIYQGIEKKFLKKLEGHSSETIVRLGQAGWVARGVAFGILGVLVVVAGVKSQPAKARGLDNALKTLAGAPYGKWVLCLIALGFAAYGVFQVITAPRHVEG